LPHVIPNLYDFLSTYGTLFGRKLTQLPKANSGGCNGRRPVRAVLMASRGDLATDARGCGL